MATIKATKEGPRLSVTEGDRKTVAKTLELLRFVNSWAALCDNQSMKLQCKEALAALKAFEHSITPTEDGGSDEKGKPE